MKLTDIIKLAGCLLLCFSAAFFGSYFVNNSQQWYANLEKPFFNPPDWVFGPVWTVLYFLMGVSLFIVIKHDLKKRLVSIAFFIFVIQLSLNALWTPVFFGLKSPLWAFLLILVLWVFILVTTILFRRISLIAALLLIPYLIWTTYAAFLNAAIVVLN